MADNLPLLSEQEIEALRKRAIELANGEDKTAVWQTVAPLLAQSKNKAAARALLEVIDHQGLSREHALEAVEAVFREHADDVRMVGLIGWSLDQAIDINFLNAAPSEHPIIAETVRILRAALPTVSTRDEVIVLEGLTVAARLSGRRNDEIAERAHKRMIEIDGTNPYRHYNYGLFLKNRGRFEDGMRANQRAVELSTKPSEAAQWNLGICATGARHADVALKIWKAMGHKIEIGRFDLPEGRFPQSKVRLAERPLAERTSASDDPGEEETIWIERLSACHGIVRSVLYRDLGVDYGDVVLIDGAPITHHKYDDVEVPVFPHLATLIRSNYQFFDFAGTQEEPSRIEDLNDALPDDAIVYSHTDKIVTLCSNCWNNPTVNHAAHDEIAKQVISGRIAVPPHISPADLLAQLDASAKKIAPSRLFAPDLCRAAGQPERAQIEQRRFDMLRN